MTYTKPWQDEEYIIFDGFKLIYFAKNKIIEKVRMPGGWSCSLKQLKSMSTIDLVYPFKIRNTRFGEVDS